MLIQYYLVVLYLIVFTLMSYVFSSVDIIIGFCFFTVFASVAGFLLNSLDNIWYEEHKQYRNYMGKISLVYYNLGYMETYMEEKEGVWENYFLFLENSLSYNIINAFGLKETREKLKSWLANKLNKYMLIREKINYKRNASLKLYSYKTILSFKYIDKFCK